MNNENILKYIWDYKISVSDFLSILSNEMKIGRLDQNWAALRLLEYGTYEEIVHYIGFANLIRNWPCWKDKIRSKQRYQGFEFIVNWIPKNYPELINT